MADELSIEVYYSSPGTVGVTKTIELQYTGDDLGGLNWTVWLSDSGAGGSFNPEDVAMGDPTSGSPTTVQVQYTPAAPGNVSFDFSDDLAMFFFSYAPPFLVVQAANNQKKSSAFMQFL